MEAAAGAASGKDGHLSNAHLKQLCILKGRYSTDGGTPNKMRMLKLLRAMMPCFTAYIFTYCY